MYYYRYGVDLRGALAGRFFMDTFSTNVTGVPMPQVFRTVPEAGPVPGPMPPRREKTAAEFFWFFLGR
jgi:hypothetical protein